MKTVIAIDPGNSGGIAGAGRWSVLFCRCPRRNRPAVRVKRRVRARRLLPPFPWWQRLNHHL